MGERKKLRVKIHTLPVEAGASTTNRGSVCSKIEKKNMLYVLHLFSKINRKKKPNNNNKQKNKTKTRIQHMNPQCEVYMYFLEIKLDWL